jgi:hypothetical protein
MPRQMRLILSGSTLSYPQAPELTVHRHQPEPLVANGRGQESRSRVIPCRRTAQLPSLLVEIKWARRSQESMSSVADSDPGRTVVVNRLRGEIWRSRSQLVSAAGRTAMVKMRHGLS